jgi:hypothetical protein
MDNESFDLDSSWIEEEESRYNTIKEREKLDSICCYFIYIGTDSSILKVIKEDEVLSEFGLDSDSDKKKGIQNNRLLHIIQNKRLLDSGQRFKISNVLKYVVDIDPGGLSLFSSLDKDDLIDSGFLKEVNIFGDIVIESSIFCFHSIASLYFFFREDGMIMKPVRSILKPKNDNSSGSKSSTRATKKVRILEEIIGDNEDNVDIISLNTNNKTKKVRD